MKSLKSENMRLSRTNTRLETKLSDALAKAEMYFNKLKENGFQMKGSKLVRGARARQKGSTALDTGPVLDTSVTKKQQQEALASEIRQAFSSSEEDKTDENDDLDSLCGMPWTFSPVMKCLSPLPPSPAFLSHIKGVSMKLESSSDEESLSDMASELEHQLLGDTGVAMDTSSISENTVDTGDYSTDVKVDLNQNKAEADPATKGSDSRTEMTSDCDGADRTGRNVSLQDRLKTSILLSSPNMAKKNIHVLPFENLKSPDILDSRQKFKIDSKATDPLKTVKSRNEKISDKEKELREGEGKPGIDSLPTDADSPKSANLTRTDTDEFEPCLNEGERGTAVSVDNESDFTQAHKSAFVSAVRKKPVQLPVIPNLHATENDLINEEKETPTEVVQEKGALQIDNKSGVDSQFVKRSLRRQRALSEKDCSDRLDMQSQSFDTKLPDRRLMEAKKKVHRSTSVPGPMIGFLDAKKGLESVSDNDSVVRSVDSGRKAMIHSADVCSSQKSDSALPTSNRRDGESLKTSEISCETHSTESKPLARENLDQNNIPLHVKHKVSSNSSSSNSLTEKSSSGSVISELDDNLERNSLTLLSVHTDEQCATGLPDRDYQTQAVKVPTVLDDSTVEINNQTSDNHDNDKNSDKHSDTAKGVYDSDLVPKTPSRQLSTGFIYNSPTRDKEGDIHNSATRDKEGEIGVRSGISVRQCGISAASSPASIAEEEEEEEGHNDDRHKLPPTFSITQTLSLEIKHICDSDLKMCDTASVQNTQKEDNASVDLATDVLCEKSTGVCITGVQSSIANEEKIQTTDSSRANDTGALPVVLSAQSGRNKQENSAEHRGESLVVEQSSSQISENNLVGNIHEQKPTSGLRSSTNSQSALLPAATQNSDTVDNSELNIVRHPGPSLSPTETDVKPESALRQTEDSEMPNKVVKSLSIVPTVSIATTTSAESSTVAMATGESHSVSPTDDCSEPMSPLSPLPISPFQFIIPISPLPPSPVPHTRPLSPLPNSPETMETEDSPSQEDRFAPLSVSTSYVNKKKRVARTAGRREVDPPCRFHDQIPADIPKPKALTRQHSDSGAAVVKETRQKQTTSAAGKDVSAKKNRKTSSEVTEPAGQRRKRKSTETAVLQETLEKKPCKEPTFKRRSKSVPEPTDEYSRKTQSYLKSKVFPETFISKMTSQAATETAIPRIITTCIQCLERNKADMLEVVYISCSHDKHQSDHDKWPYLTGPEKKAVSLFLYLLKQKQQPAVSRDSVMGEIWHAMFSREIPINMAGKKSLCRVYTSLCKETGDVEQARVMFYHVMVCGHMNNVSFVVPVASIWPHVLQKQPGAGGMLLVMEEIIMTSLRAQENNGCNKVSVCIQKLCHWEEREDGDRASTLLKLLLKNLEAATAAKSKLSSCVWDLEKAVELLSVSQGWAWFKEDFVYRNALQTVSNRWYLKGKHCDVAPKYICSILRITSGVIRSIASPVSRDVTSLLKNWMLPIVRKEPSCPEVRQCCVEAIMEISPLCPIVLCNLQGWHKKNRDKIPTNLVHKLEELRQLYVTSSGLVCQVFQTYSGTS